MKNEFERLRSHVMELADVLDLQMSDFTLEEERTKPQIIIKKAAEDDRFSPFDDEPSFKFYRDLPDLKRFVEKDS